MRHALMVSGLLLAIFEANYHPTAARAQFPLTYIPSGQLMYKNYCAACHGADAKGNGPASTLKASPADLTTLAKRHSGKFPYDYVSTILRFGSGTTAHGSKDMPTWGPIFYILDKNNEAEVRRRIDNLCNYLASLQEK